MSLDTVALLAAETASLDTWDVSARLGAAALLGGALGFEREARGRDAGLRTHMLLSLGSALFSVASVGAFDGFIEPRADTNVAVDITRIAAYVAPGVGFIGAGVIVKRVKAGGKPNVHGLTTAASLWAAAAVGVAAGLGFWSGAVVATVVALVALSAFRPLSALVDRRRGGRHHRTGLTVTARRDAVPAVLDAIGSRLVGDVRVGSAGADAPVGAATLTGTLRLDDGERSTDVIATLVALDGVVEVDVSPSHDDDERGVSDVD